ncbi:MAG: GFA family protein [Sphingomonas fennica]
MIGGCHCGAVGIAVPALPDHLNQCNCSACFTFGTLWGYYSAAEVTITGAVRAYRRADRQPPLLDLNFCGTCGARTHWSPTEHFDSDRIGVNMRLFDPAALAGLPVRYGDRRHHSHTEPRRTYREPTVFDGAGVAP